MWGFWVIFVEDVSSGVGAEEALIYDTEGIGTDGRCENNLDDAILPGDEGFVDPLCVMQDSCRNECDENPTDRLA